MARAINALNLSALGQWAMAEASNEEDHPTFRPNLAFARLEQDLGVVIPGEAVHDVCEQLHALVHEREGTCLYVPAATRDATLCRFEWLGRHRGKKHGLHVGLHFVATTGDTSTVTAYVTSNDVITFGTDPHLPGNSKRYRAIRNRARNHDHGNLACPAQDERTPGISPILRGGYVGDRHGHEAA